MNALYMIRVASAAAPLVPVDIGDTFEFNRRVSGAISALSAGSMLPVAMIAVTATTTAPPGWLICDGSAVGRDQFPALFDAIGTAYGAGDGVSTFNIPTQAQSAPNIATTTPPQTITGGAVDPVVPAPSPTPGSPGPSGGGNVTGGRVHPLGPNERIA